MSASNPYRPPQAPIEPPATTNVTVPTGVAWRVILTVGILGLIVGLASRSVRPMFAGPIHYDMVAATFLQISEVIAVVVVFRRRQLRDGIINMNLAIAAIWSAFFVGWTLRHGAMTLIHGRIWDDLVGMTAVFWLGSAIFGSLSMYSLYLSSH